MDSCSLAGNVSTSQWKTSDNFMADRQVGTAKPGDGKGRIYLFILSGFLNFLVLSIPLILING